MSSNSESYIKALDLFIESVYKPDFQLRLEAREQECFDELMSIREDMIKYLQDLRSDNK